MDGKVGDVCNVVALEAIPLQTNDAGPNTSISSPVLPDFEKLLRSIPNSDGLKQLLDVSVNWTRLCAKKHGGEVPSADGDDQKAEFSAKVQEMYEVLRVATNLKGEARVLAAMAPDLLDMAHTFAAVIPSVLEATTGFEKFASPIISLLEERVKQLEQLVALKDEVAKTRDQNKELVQELKAMQYKLDVLESKKRRDGKRSMAELADASPRAEDVVVLECTTQTSDNLVLSQFEGDVQHDVTVKDGSGMAKPLYTDVPV